MLVRLILSGALLLVPLTVHAQQAAPEPSASDSAAAELSADEIEQTIARLEDPEARARLVADLKVLLEQEREESAGTAAGEPVDLWQTAQDLVVSAWDTVTSIDPRQVVISAGISLIIVILALLLRWGLLRLLRRFYGRLATGTDEQGTADAEDAAAQGAAAEPAAGRPDVPELPPTVVRLVNLVVAVLAVALIAESWGAGLAGLLQTDLGSRIARSALSIGVILVVTAVLWNVSGLVVARLLTLGTSKKDQDRTARRLDTLVPLLRSVLQVTIGVMSGLLILSELGLDIGPLLAGAGILGLAVGFGAQTLVKDLITGVTILLEDGATVGDVVEVAGHAGVVEEMRIRIMQLRDLSGHVHLLPYSEVTTIVNMTKDFSYYLMDIGVAYRENTDEVFEVISEVCENMRNDPEWQADIHEPLEILGVNRFADSAVEIRARIRTDPGRQWAVGREYNRRMKHAFDERGIEIPFPHTTLYFGEDKSGKAPPAYVALEDRTRRRDETVSRTTGRASSDTGPGATSGDEDDA